MLEDPVIAEDLPPVPSQGTQSQLRLNARTSLESDLGPGRTEDPARRAERRRGTFSQRRTIIKSTPHQRVLITVATTMNRNFAILRRRNFGNRPRKGLIAPFSVRRRLARKVLLVPRDWPSRGYRPMAFHGQQKEIATCRQSRPVTIQGSITRMGER